jgi:ketosteroid isomerase-like protein
MPSDIDADLHQLQQLNHEYISSVQHSDVTRFDEILAPDFICITADGERLGRKEFLRRTAVRTTIQGLEAIEVEIRLMGDFAIVHGRSVYVLADGTPASRRYTDCWARRDGHWVAVSAQLTHTQAATL